AVAAIAAALAVPAAGAATAGATLVATVGPGFSISLTQGGKKVSKLKAGTYTITVQDKSNIHDFHLTGPGVNRKTSVAAIATTTWRLTLRRGTYRFVCDPHASLMKGKFVVQAP
ncbi:MAG TPA: plastocyanin/azurin family copper-binding protein, partial [Solirubrobacteraceae bacterium]